MKTQNQTLTLKEVEKLNKYIADLLSQMLDPQKNIELFTLPEGASCFPYRESLLIDNRRTLRKHKHHNWLDMLFYESKPYKRGPHHYNKIDLQYTTRNGDVFSFVFKIDECDIPGLVSSIYCLFRDEKEYEFLANLQNLNFAGSIKNSLRLLNDLLNDI